MPHVFDSRKMNPAPSPRSDMPQKERKMAPGWPARGPSRSVVSQGALHELSVAFEVQQAVAAVVERNHGLFVPYFRLEREIDRPANGVAGLRRGNQPLRPSEDLAGPEGVDLVHRARLDEA